ncbi:Ubiquitin [Cordyceps militaris]|uniref:Ubiquitin n=1 Tax=Cordyceps militaris TaxID=73501 RepID=A0A2H4SAC5_CORMI|nr:Ubiquitin [Cordyceps militaris]
MKHHIFSIAALAAQVCLGFKFYALTMAGNVYTLTGEDSTKVSVIEQQLEQVAHIPVAQQKILFKGRELKSDNVLSDYGIQEGSEVRVVLRLRANGELRSPTVSQDVSAVWRLAELKEVQMLGNARHVKLGRGCARNRTARGAAIDWMLLSSFVLLAAEDIGTSELCDAVGESSDLPPVYRSVDPLSEDFSERDAPASEGPHETPRKRFDYHVRRLREIRQVEEWRRTYMHKRFYTNLETPNIPARDWVIKQWQKQGIWANTWPDTGPGDEERWNCGGSESIPAWLLSIELGWEFEYIVLVQNPVLLPCLAATRARLPTNITPVTWKPRDIGQQALSQLLARWTEEGFSSCTIQQSTLEYRRDLGELRDWLPPLARNCFDSLKVFSWPDLLNGWQNKLGDHETDQPCFGLSPESRDMAEAAVKEAQAESRRVEALRRKSPLQAPTAAQNVTGEATADGAADVEAEESSGTSSRQSRKVEMPGAPGPRFDERATSTEASREDGSERGTRRSSRRARSSAAGLSEASDHRAANRDEVGDAAGSSEDIVSRRRRRRPRDDDHGQGAKRRRLA